MTRPMMFICALLGLVSCNVKPVANRYIDIGIEVEYQSKIYRGQTTIHYQKYVIEGSITPESNGVRTKVFGNVPHVSIPGVGMVVVPFKGESDDRATVLHNWIASALKAGDMTAKQFITTWATETLNVPIGTISEYLLIRGTTTFDSVQALTPGKAESGSPQLLSLEMRVSDAVQETSSLEHDLPFLIKKNGGRNALPNLNLPTSLWSLR